MENRFKRMAQEDIISDGRREDTDPQKLESESDQEKRELIGGSGSIDELIKNVHIVAPVRTGTGMKDGDNIEMKIEWVRHCQRNIGMITRSLGISDTLKRLLSDDPIYKKSLRRLSGKMEREARKK